MKKRETILTAVLIVLLLFAGCGAERSIEGVWEQEITVSVLGLGVEEPVQRTDTLRFEFRKDGTGLMTTGAGAAHPAPEVVFHYALEGDTLTIVQDDDGSDMVFTVAMEGESLKLENQRGTFDLKRIS